jgi:ubiquitin carboxyl-terminal hydrolase 14
VAPERQKVMVKGGMLKDDQEWAKAGIKPGAKLMMMGTADAVPQAPTAHQVRGPNSQC